ncbi:MAG: TolC family protein [Myxococcota bacterium]
MTLLSAVPAGAAERLAEYPDVGIDDCVRIALDLAAPIAGAEAQVDVFRARLREVESIFYPKLEGLAFVAPMYSVRGNVDNFDVQWRNIRDWGPYTNFEATLTQVVYTFGRAEAGQNAALERIEVEKARVREARNIVAREVRRLFYSYMFTESVRPALVQATEVLNEAIERAQDMYDNSTGEVSFADLSRLKFAQVEVAKLDVLLETAALVLLSALKHTMGLPRETVLTFKETRLPRLKDSPPPKLEELVRQALDNRPEWKQLASGKRALDFLEEAELKSNLPAIGIAGQVAASWTPTRDNNTNPYLRDPYNEFSGGIALALLFDLDPERSLARADAARAQKTELEALERFASTGIPLQVQQARADLVRFKSVAQLSQDEIKITRKWLTFAASGYETGASNARDLLEGLAAYIESKRSYYDGLRSYHIADAELLFALGKE